MNSSLPSNKLEDLEIKDAQLIFDAVWHQFETDLGLAKLQFPKEICWLNGAPGAGKGTHTAFIMQYRHFTAGAIVVSNLLQSEEARIRKDTGLLAGDKEVTYLVLRELLEPKYAQGAVVDGYPRTTVQVECIKLFYKKLEELYKNNLQVSKNKLRFRKPHFRVIVLFVDENESVDRQLKRGQETIKENEKIDESGVGQKGEIRKTDLDAEAARNRYRVFKELTYNSLRSLKNKFPYHFINAHGSLAEVQKKIIKELEYQSSLELSQNTYDRLTSIPLAISLGQHARQQLVERLDAYESNQTETFQKVIALIEAKLMPIIIRHAMSGLALVNLEDAILEEPNALSMLIDILSERGYSAVVDVRNDPIPESIDPKTHQIKTCIKTVYRIQIRFPRSQIRHFTT